MSRRLSILIADDEALARQRLVRLLAGMPEVELSAECKNGAEVLSYLSSSVRAPDLLLLDIRMPELTGLEACALLPETPPYVIFTTAHAEHALEAFDVGADDYLLKPIEAGRLKLALERARRRLQPGVATGTLQRLPLQTAQGIVLVNPLDVSHAELDGVLVTLHTTGGRMISDLSLQELHDRLPDPRFWRVHRRALINLDKLERLTPLDSGGFVAHMLGGSRVTVSRQAGRRLRKHLGLAG